MAPHDMADPALTDPDWWDARHAGLDAQARVADALSGPLAGRIAVVSSFGADAASLLHLVAAVDPAAPVIFIDTWRHFEETLAYRRALATRLGLTNVVAVGPTAEDVARLDPELMRAGYDPDGCCDFRKTKPLKAALAPYAAWISGRKRFQSAERAAIAYAEIDDGRLKLNPLADWTAEMLAAHRARHDLPDHPLVARGYPSIGCAPCTTPVAPGEDPRAGRWRGQGKVECGIHVAAAPAGAA